jgi:membrane protease YdiL (CAAX protease family)
VAEDNRSWQSYLIPVVVAMGVFGGLNALWSLPQLALYDRVPHSLGVYLPSALVALGLIWLVLRKQTITRRELGLDTSGWTAPKRLLGLAMVMFMGYGGYATLQPPTGEPPVEEEVPVALAAYAQVGAQESENIAVPVAKPTPLKPGWGDYCFWFVFLLSASLTELMVFICLGFCLTERWLKRVGMRPVAACVTAALFASVMFGVYHYTHEPRWWRFAIYPLIPVMLINLTYFVLTRNFYLTLLLHNAFAAVGFTGEQYAERFKAQPDRTMDPANFLDPSGFILGSLLLSFLLPFLILHWLEGRGQEKAIAAAEPA